MKELLEITTRYAELRRQGRTAALATVVRVSGSTYRRSGAKMLVADDGSAIGCVSGGCLERDVIEQATRVMVTGEPRVLTYESNSDGDVLWGFGLGCNGTVDVLVERVGADRHDHLAFMVECVALRREGVIATVLSVTGDTHTRVGARLMLRRQQVECSSGHMDDALRQAVIADARQVFDGPTQIKTYCVPGGSVDVLLDVIRSPLALVVFGAGHDAEPVVRLAKGMGWHVAVVDHRPHRIETSRAWNADSATLAHSKELARFVYLEARTAAVIMNHNFLQDLETLRFVLQSPVQYIGVLGPQQRTIRMLSDLARDGMNVTQADLDRVFGPVGLDLGAENPEEIALSIVAEIAAVAAGRSGMCLRDRSGPLHAQLAASGDETRSCRSAL
jgi:xanthine dehydrogenase accessory factor